MNKLSQLMQDPIEVHWLGCKRVLRYLQGINEYGLKFTVSGRLDLVSFSNADWACDVEDRKLIGGYYIFLVRILVSWSSKKQKVVVISSTKSEYNL